MTELTGSLDILEELTGDISMQGPPGKNTLGYCIRRLGPYIYDAAYDVIQPYIPDNDFTPTGCSSFVRDGKLHRNLDWNYAETAEFRVITHDFKGMAFKTGVDDGTIEQHYKELEQLPYRIVDGRNNDGIMVSTHVLIDDWDYDGEGDKSVSIQLLPYLVLTNLHSMEDIHNLETFLHNLYVPIKMKEMHYLCQFLVTDGTTSYVITPSDNGYELVDISENPKLTNFKWVNRATVTRTDSDIQLHPTGIERWNTITDDTTLADLRFTKAYETSDYLSEFIGIDGTTKESTDEELTDIYNRAHAEYLVRERDGKTWQTMHSVVYSAIGMEDLWVQEDYVPNYTDIPKKGDPGLDGVYVVSTEVNAESHLIVTLSNGRVLDAGYVKGDPGADGITPHIGTNGHWYIGDEDTGVKAEGTDGHTPEKGVDYWTETDKAEIVEEVLKEIPVGDEVSY